VQEWEDELDTQTLWIVALILGFPTLVIGGAIFGGRLPPSSGRRIEIFVLLPLLVLLGALEHDHFKMEHTRS